MVKSKKMTDKEALSWLLQPGIVATLYHYDRHTNEALELAVKALRLKVEQTEGIKCGVNNVFSQR